MKNSIIKTGFIPTAVLTAIFTMFILSCQKSDLVPVITDDSDFLTEEKLQAPVVPDTIAVPDGNKVIWHTYASGVQIYEVKESTTNPGQYVWTFVAPAATLYKKPDFTKQVGTHYAGPTWEATVGPAKGKYVIGNKISSVTDDVSAIPWLLLKAVPSTDPEYYSTVTYIQRLYTTGGLAPATGATAENLGMQQSVPYTAAYYFYGAK